MFKKLILALVVPSFIFSACPEGFYEDDCGNCWMPYCYDFVTHDLSYDTNESECDGQTEIWVIPGDSGDPFFNNYCSDCPENYYEDDCGNCWLGYCYTLFSDGLNGDGPHSVYYDLSEQECESYGYGFYPPGSTGDPYFNSNCEGCPEGEIVDDCGICQSGEDSPYWNMTCGDCNGVANGTALVDDCGDCQSAYCYDYVTHEVSFTGACDGPTQMLVMPDSPSNPYWNSSCDPNGCPDGEVEDCSGTCGGSSLVDDCGDCQSAYCYDYVTHEVSFTGACDGPTQMFVMPDDPMNPYWNQGCNYCPGIIGDANSDNSVDVSDIVLIVSFILGNNTSEIEECQSDINEDGIVNVVDVVQIVQMILGNLGVEANIIDLNIDKNSIDFDANGIVWAFELTIEHNSDFEITLSENSLYSGFKTEGNKTKVIIILPENDELVLINGEYKLTNAVAVNSEGYISVNLFNSLDTFVLNDAYPNPFNPKTNLSYVIPNDGEMNLSVFDVKGNLIENLYDGFVKSGEHKIEWDGTYHSSGMYILRLEFNNQTKSQKLFLIK